MLNIIPSKASKPNPDFARSPRLKEEGNGPWLERNLKLLAGEKGAAGTAYLAMFGGKMDADFRIRVAQGQLRSDMSPSHWSHVVLLQGSGPTRKGALWEISLEPKGGFGFPPRDNGVQEGHLKNYGSRNQFPNVAVMRLPVQLDDLRVVLRHFKHQRAELDCVELIVLWLAFAWGAGRAGNPLLDGYGTPSAAFIEALTSAAGFDLTPGLESRASCPEAIWQAARWWHEYHGRGDSSCIRGMWHTEHHLAT